MLNEILERMVAKVNCVELQSCGSWHQNLKYYGYSTVSSSFVTSARIHCDFQHDHTVFALLAVLGLENVVAGPEKYGQWPDYSADILIELYQNRTDKKAYFKVSFNSLSIFHQCLYQVVYLKNVQGSFETVTEKVPGCEGLPYCALKVLEGRAKVFKPDKPMKEWCQTAPQVELPIWMKHLLQDRTDSSASQDYFMMIAMMVALM